MGLSLLFPLREHTAQTMEDNNPLSTSTPKYKSHHVLSFMLPVCVSAHMYIHASADIHTPIHSTKEFEFSVPFFYFSPMLTNQQ